MRKSKDKSRILFTESNVVGHQCFSMPQIKDAIIYHRVGKVVPGAPGNPEGTDQLELSSVVFYQVHFATLVVVVEHPIGSDHRTLTYSQ